MFLPDGFEKAIAQECGNLVNQAYTLFAQFQQGHEQDWRLEGDYDNLGMIHAKPKGIFTKEEPFGLVARKRTSGNVFVTFRGTEGLDDWLSDLTLPQVAHAWGQAEKGFTNLYQQCAAAVKTGVQSAGEAPSVFVTGHSLGASLATLAAADLVISGVNPKPAMYTLAGPRVGDPNFAQKFNEAVAVKWRIINTEDVVPTLPLATPDLLSIAHPDLALRILLMKAPKLNYQHVGTPVTFTENRGSIPANHTMPILLDWLKTL